MVSVAAAIILILVFVFIGLIFYFAIRLLTSNGGNENNNTTTSPTTSGPVTVSPSQNSGTFPNCPNNSIIIQSVKYPGNFVYYNDKYLGLTTVETDTRNIWKYNPVGNVQGTGSSKITAYEFLPYSDTTQYLKADQGNGTIRTIESSNADPPGVIQWTINPVDKGVQFINVGYGNYMGVGSGYNNNDVYVYTENGDYTTFVIQCFSI